ncbi:TPA: hypothetical protein ACH3X2_000231 [Trebouxia sp. C0005]
MSRVFLAFACKCACLTGKPLQLVGAALTGVQQMCIWAAEPSEGSQVESRTTIPVVAKPSQQTSRQVFGKPAGATLGVKHVQRGMKPDWPDSQQHGHGESHLKQPWQTGFHTPFEDCVKNREVSHMARKQTHNGKTVSAQEGLQEASRQEQQRMALAGVRGHQPHKALLIFYASMEHLCSAAGPILNYINLSAIITATAQLWASAQANSSFKLSANMAGFELKPFYCSILLRLKPMLPDVGAQAVSNILWSSAKLGLSPDASVPGMTDALAARLQLTRNEGRHQLGAQDCAIVLWALASLGHQPADKSFMDGICERFVISMKHQDKSKQPTAQNCANFLWALACLSHAPPDDAASAILERVTGLCNLSGQEPSAQNLSNTLFACAVLRLERKEHVTLALVNRLLILDRASGYVQNYCNAAWSLAVSGVLTSETFHALLQRLRPLPTAEPAHDALPRQGLHQLYQALDFLQPLPMAAAQQLHEMVTRLGQRPLPESQSDADSSVSRWLGLALGQLGLAFASDIPLSGYWPYAVLQLRDGVSDPIVLANEGLHCFRNNKHRLTGRAVFRRALLAKHGKLVLILQHKLSSSDIDELAAYLQQELEAVVGGSLEAYRC